MPPELACAPASYLSGPIVAESRYCARATAHPLKRSTQERSTRAGISARMCDESGFDQRRQQ